MEQERENHYLVDKQAIQSNQTQVAGIALAEMIKTCEVMPSTFLKQNYNLKKIRSRLSEPNFSTLVGVLITNISVLGGIKEEIDFATKADLFRNIKNYCSDLTLEEIYKAFELERYGEYLTKSNHFQLFGTDYFSEVIKKYREWKRNTLTEHNIIMEVKNQLPEISESQKTQIVTNGIIRAFNEFKENKIISEPCVHIFDELLSRGFIIGANSDKLVSYYAKKQNEAKDQLEKEILYEISNSYSSERKKLQNILEEILKGDSNKIVIRTKKIVLQEYFSKLISEDRNIDGFFNT
ncbi:hypothetical protein [Flavobacterium sp.]|uniref:hypothetical protein n=1 Tax=Flavobacterium sp. TaxID=239 RepID=UPI0037512DCF